MLAVGVHRALLAVVAVGGRQVWWAVGAMGDCGDVASVGWLWNKLVWLLTMPNQTSAFADAHLGR